MCVARWLIASCWDRQGQVSTRVRRRRDKPFRKFWAWKRRLRCKELKDVGETASQSAQDAPS